MSFNIGKEKAKIGLKCKIKPEMWDKTNALYSGPNADSVNYLIEELKKETPKV